MLLLSRCFVTWWKLSWKKNVKYNYFIYYCYYVECDVFVFFFVVVFFSTPFNPFLLCDAHWGFGARYMVYSSTSLERRVAIAAKIPVTAENQWIGPNGGGKWRHMQQLLVLRGTRKEVWQSVYNVPLMHWGHRKWTVAVMPSFQLVNAETKKAAIKARGSTWWTQTPQQPTTTWLSLLGSSQEPCTPVSLCEGESSHPQHCQTSQRWHHQHIFTMAFDVNCYTSIVCILPRDMTTPWSK